MAPKIIRERAMNETGATIVATTRALPHADWTPAQETLAKLFFAADALYRGGFPDGSVKPILRDALNAAHLDLYGTPYSD